MNLPTLDRRGFLVSGLALSAAVGSGHCFAADSPSNPSSSTGSKIKLLDVWRIYGDGLHNAFPGIARFKDHYYVAFRKALEHQSIDDAKILVIRSKAGDLKNWEQVGEFTREHDSRDPLLVVIGDQLQLVWHSKTDWYSRTADGTNWTETKELQAEFRQPPADSKMKFTSDRRWLFRIRRGPDGAYYSLARCGLLEKGSPGPFGVLLYRSEDGIHFKSLHGYGEGPIAATSKINAPGTGHECDVAWRPDGSIVTAIRMREGAIAQAPSASGPWSAYMTGVFNFGGPALHTAANGDVLLAARSEPQNKIGPSKQMVWTVGKSGLENQLELPSASDCAYSSFADAENGEILICYYSGHEKIEKQGGSKRPANIYLARLKVS